MRRLIALWAMVALALPAAKSQENLLTTAEKSGFKSTSTYADVISFIEKLKKSSPYVRVGNIAKSVEGREVPLLIIGKPLPQSPESIRNDGRIVVYVQANIHAGEVEGKEATLMFARDLLKEKDPVLLRDVVFLICPIFNPDGNEPISPRNRTYQNGPVNGVGVRYNGQFLDLNRDAMKAESPEVRGAISNIFDKWDPAVFMDCHTTDGSYHVEPVTFTWMVNPAGDTSLIYYMRTKMVPQMSATLLNKYKTLNCFYGEFNDLLKPETGWFYDAFEPRYMTNYYGLRNRLAILNENYVYAGFESRVKGCYNLIWSLGDYVSAHKDEIRGMLKKADERTIARGLNPTVKDSFPVGFKVRALPEKVTIMTYEAQLVADSNGRKIYRKTDHREDVTVPYYIDYYPSKSVRFPYAYLITVHDPAVIGLLKLHGIRLESLSKPSKLGVEEFRITDLNGAPRLNQGHYTNTVEGKFEETSIDFPSGTIVVRTAQPLADVAAYLLEPESDDGLLTWNFLDRYLVPQWGMGYNPYPIYKILNKTELSTVPLK
ncbi:MAG: M14 family metallopeptidase [Bacteroidales bacterium]